MGCLRRVIGVAFVTKTTGLKSAKPGMSSHFSEPTDPTYNSLVMCPEYLRK